MKTVVLFQLILPRLRSERLRSGLMILAIALGIALTALMLALTSGLRQLFVSGFEATGRLRQVIVTRVPSLSYQQALTQSSSDSGVVLDDRLIGQIRQLPDVEAVTPVAIPYVFDSLQLGRQTLAAPLVQAYQPGDALHYTSSAGRELVASDGTGIITLTPQVADALGYHGAYDHLIGQTLVLRTHSGYSGPGAVLPPPGTADTRPEPTELTARIVGVVTSPELGQAVFVPLSWGRRLMSTSHWEGNQRVFTTDLERTGYQSLVVSTRSVDTTERMAGQLRGLGVGAVTARSFVEQQTRLIDVAGLILGSIGLVALLVAALGITATMSMAVLEQTREIGVIRALGGSRRLVQRLFLLEAALYGLSGGLLGLVLAYAAMNGISRLVESQLQMNGLPGGRLVGLPISQAGLILIAALLLSTAAAWYPARRAARLDPAEALRRT